MRTGFVNSSDAGKLPKWARESTMAYLAKIEGDFVAAVDIKTKMKKFLSCAGYKGVRSASTVDEESIAIECKDGTTLLWNVKENIARVVR